MKQRGAKLGQHFLTAHWAVERMADAANITEGTAVLEIGPGKGVLTKELLSRGAQVIAIEKDTALATLLRETFAEEATAGKLVLIENDIRSASPDTLQLPERYVVAANIPYYITGEIIRSLLTAAHQPTTIALLIQKEVAERIVARDGKESILSLSVKAYGDARIVAKVPRGAFAPSPSVDSAILSIESISRSSFKDVSEERFFTIVKAGFSSKRKMLAGNLRALFSSEEVTRAFDACGIGASARAEDVPLSKWLCLVKSLKGNL